jgi:hypothetical protein
VSKVEQGGRDEDAGVELLLPVTLMVTTPASLAPTSCEQRHPRGGVLGEGGSGVREVERRGRAFIGEASSASEGRAR